MIILNEIMQLAILSYHEWIKQKPSTLGAAIAFYFIFSLGPILVIIIGAWKKIACTRILLNAILEYFFSIIINIIIICTNLLFFIFFLLMIIYILNVYLETVVCYIIYIFKFVSIFKCIWCGRLLLLKLLILEFFYGNCILFICVIIF